jgi:hypothetical protein
MNTDKPEAAPAPSAAAERMRRYRKRQRDGMHYVRVALHVRRSMRSFKCGF